MASPFNIFRRNQRIMMVVLTGLSMFAFIFIDATTARSGGLPKSITIVFFAALCALGLWYVGRRHGKSNEWALWGAVLGAVAAFFFVRTSAEPTTSFRSNFGNITESKLRDLGQKRYLANQFVTRASALTQAKRGSQGFGPADDRSMMQFLLGRQEVKRLGISLNDAAVNRFIDEITDNKLSKADFGKVLKEINLSVGDLFDILRDELEVRLAFEVQAPPYDMWMDFNPQSFQMFPRPKLPATPEEQWEFFEKMNVKQSLSAVALEVNDFLPKVPEPSETELKELFEQRKDKAPGALGQPGFIQPHRSKVAYLAAEFVKFESQVATPTDEEVAAYYEENKSRYPMINEFPDSSFDDDAPADASQPQNIAPELPPVDAPESDSEAKPDSEKKPESKDDEKKDEDKTEGKKPDEKKEGDSSSAAKVKSTGVVRLVSATADDKEEAEKKEPAEEKKEEEQKAEEKKEDKKDEKPAKEPAADTPGDEKPKTDDEPSEGELEEMPNLPLPSDKKKEIRYRLLDDDLKEKIREEILHDRAFDKMGLAVDLAKTEMESFAFKYVEASEADKSKVAGEIADKLKAYAAAHDLEYVETPLMSQSEFQTPLSESIGAAVLPIAGTSRHGMTVVDDLFPPTGQVGPLYYPQRADSRLRDKRYAWWKIEDKLQHAPSWSDEGIPEQVKTAWKYEKGRQMAKDRADQLKLAVMSMPDDFAGALAGMTVTGEPGTESVVIKETPRFSWLSAARSTPFDSFLPPRLSFITGIDQPGDDFMRVVFADLKNGEVGIAPNEQRSVFYLVKVRDRDGTEPPADVEGFQTLASLRERFLAELGSDRPGLANRSYDMMMSAMFGRVQQEWTKSFDQRYGVELDEMDDASQASRSRRRR